MKKNKDSKDINGTLIKESLLDYDNLATKIKENAPDLVKSLLGEQVRQAYASLLNESDDEDDDTEEKDYDVEEVDDTMSDSVEDEDDGADDSDEDDDDTDGMEPDSDNDSDDDVEDDDDAEDIESDDVEDDDSADDLDDDGDDEISQTFDKYKTSDGKYDFRNAEDDELVKVYKLLKNDDNVTVVKDDNKVHISDGETGVEYIIDLGDDADTSDVLDDDINEDNMNESRIYEIALNEYDSHVGYTDGYQKKDVMTNGGVSEPSKYGRDIDKGVPHGSEKPWSRQKKSVAPFNKNVNEDDYLNEPVEEDLTRGGAHSTMTTIKHTSESDNDGRNLEKTVGRTKGTGGPRTPNKMQESIIRKANRIFNENAKLKEMLGKFQSQLMEAAVTNVNLGGIIKLISENSTTKEEKKSIINRFINEAHTITESQNLYNRISDELKKKPSVTTDINEEKKFGSQEKINESKLYQDESIMDSLGLMHKICK